MVLDNEGVSKAATDRFMYVRLKVAYDEGHRVVTSAAVLAELLRGSGRDAQLHRVLARVGVEPVSEAIGQRAGHLIAAAGRPPCSRCASGRQPSSNGTSTTAG